ncbi:MAG: zinc-ribbon domain-containing protein [Methanobrevibacter sp.]|nr:zinc-ribbon domain-containing protein [Methanobrevibacter sp.]
MSKFCPSCGEELKDDAKFCKNCGASIPTSEQTQTTGNVQQNYPIQTAENDHKIAMILGYVFALLIPLIGIIIGIYMATRNDSANAKKHGKYIIILALVVWFISFLMVMRG